MQTGICHIVPDVGYAVVFPLFQKFLGFNLLHKILINTSQNSLKSLVFFKYLVYDNQDRLSREQVNY